MATDPPRKLPALGLPDLLPEERRALARLVALVRRLRGPGGCAWDQEQTLESMTTQIVEEAYEVIDAIERSDVDAIQEELGDLLFLLLFAVDLGQAAGHFTLTELIDGHLAKMVRRHPHVFGEGASLDASESRRQWERIKQGERGKDGVLDRQVPGLPALSAAHRVQQKAAAVGFDWPDQGPVLRKIDEELAELRHELNAAQPDPTRVAGELGDLVFALVNLARWCDVDAERALRGTVARFVRRFGYIEERLAGRGQRPEDATLEEMDALWEEAKRKPEMR